MKEIQLRLFQVTPSERLLNKPAAQAIEAIFDGNLVENDTALDRLMAATTVRDLLACFSTGSKDDNRRITLALHHVFSSLDEPINWSPAQRGIRVSEFDELAIGRHRNFVAARFATFSADQCINGQVYFNVAVRNRGIFSENLAVADIMDDLRRISGTRHIYLPAFDPVHHNSCVITGFSAMPLYYKLEGRQETWGAFLIKHGRLTQAECDRRMAAYEAGQKSEAEIVIAWCRHGRSAKVYAYPARDLLLIASTALHGFVDDRRTKSLPDALEEAGDLCAAGFKAIRAGMEDKASVVDDLEQTLSDWFETIPARTASCFALNYERHRDIRRRGKYSLKAIAPSKDELALLNSRNALLYPIDGTTEKTKEVFLGFFNGGQARNLGYEFKVLDFHQHIAIEQPWTIAERIEAAVGPSANVVMAWRRRSNGQLTNNKLVEFELMRRGMAVQHVIDEGQRGNANKVGHLLQGMTEKFALRPNRKCDADSPFDLALGLDISRFGGQDIPAFPVMVDKAGNAALYMPETFERGAKERRSVQELVTILAALTGGESKKVLFLRDGYVYEDFEAVAAALPRVELTVLSIRKNLLGAFSDEMPSGELYAMYADHAPNRFLFGVNARQGEDARINSVHMVEIVRNPGGYEKDEFANVLIELSRQNRTSEFEIASLPFPIAYADRSAWVVRDMMQDRQLRKYVRERYIAEVNQLGDEGLFIYSVIRNYVLTRKNGYAFAI